MVGVAEIALGVSQQDLSAPFRELRAPGDRVSPGKSLQILEVAMVLLTKDHIVVRFTAVDPLTAGTAMAELVSFCRDVLQRQLTVVTLIPLVVLATPRRVSQEPIEGPLRSLDAPLQGRPRSSLPEPRLAQRLLLPGSNGDPGTLFERRNPRCSDLFSLGKGEQKEHPPGKMRRTKQCGSGGRA
jgi:hypothetical protein